MSSDWPELSLIDVATISSGKRPSLVVKTFSSENPVPIVGGGGVSGYTSDSLFHSDVLITGRVGTLGKLHVFSAACWPSDNALVIQAKAQSVRFDFLRYSLSAVIERAVGMNRGAANPLVTQTDLGKLPIKVPPFAEQAAIALALQALDDRIALLRETNATLEAIAQALFKSWFVDFDPVHAKRQGLAPAGMDEATAALFPDSFEESALGLVPKGWRVQRLGDVVSRITKGTTPTTLKRPFVSAGINFVKAESMTQDGGFVPEKFAFIDDETHELLKRSQLAAGDVLISIAGTIGRTALMTDDFLPANTNQAVALIRPLPEIFPSGLLLRFLQRSDSQQLMGERVVQGVQANLSLGTLSNLMAVLPPPEVTGQLHSVLVAQVDASKAMNRLRARTLTTLRDTLLPRLISGQLRLPEAASVATEAVT